ncbi:cytochrome P450 [Ganoderma sinense ZZ0214-1]|uniref:Cytochrome P450 n=1 Tax=Ganoderma sinense ZZ0214-1 TaxID=1077348 RepID=A0A2G8RMF7_9APHY|nr:cytochrome P450 [Ganoderma sinense ZZ0214-1]
MRTILDPALFLATPEVVLLLVPLSLIAVYLHRKSSEFTTRSAGRPLPPGPRGLPILGNLFDLPKASPWVGYREMSKKYGNLVCLQVLGRSILLIHDPKIASDLLEKRSVVNSSRALSTAVEMAGWAWSMAFMPYGQWWRRHRRVFWQYFHPGAIFEYQGVLEQGAYRLLSRLLTTPENFEEHLRYALGTSICKAAHGLDIAEKDDQRMEIFERALKSVDVLIEGATVLEYMPFLTAIPTWLPGTGFLRRLAEDRKYAHMLRELPWTQAKEMATNGTSSNSMASAILEKISRLDPASVLEEEGIAMSATGMAYAAGLDTQYAALQSLFPALSLHPEVQRKARAELDSVVGPNRLPTFADRDALPYVGAIVKELLRWHCVVPLGIAHCSIADDEYGGYFIPEGTTILVNSWAITHDPERYPEPDMFMPERFLKEGKLDTDAIDPAGVVFGFGRRYVILYLMCAICPGRYFADATFFIFVACVLHVFDITPPLDEDGCAIKIEPRATAGLISYLEDSRCTIRPRSSSAEELIRRTALEESATLSL